MDPFYLPFRNISTEKFHADTNRQEPLQLEYCIVESFDTITQAWKCRTGKKCYHTWTLLELKQKKCSMESVWDLQTTTFTYAFISLKWLFHCLQIVLFFSHSLFLRSSCSGLEFTCSACCQIRWFSLAYIGIVFFSHSYQRIYNSWCHIYDREQIKTLKYVRSLNQGCGTGMLIWQPHYVKNWQTVPKCLGFNKIYDITKDEIPKKCHKSRRKLRNRPFHANKI